jgi:hypothetical protein
MPEAAASGDDLDWLAGIDLSEAAPSAPTPVPGLEELSFEDLMAGAAVPPAAPSPAAPPPAAGDVPDWFADFEQAAETPAAQPAGLAPGEMPDWLDAITPEGMAAAELKAAEEEISTGALHSGTPDFMKVIDQELGGQAAGAPLGPDAAVLTEKDAAFDFEALLADQSAAMTGLGEKPQPAGGPTETLLEGTGAEMPDWLMDARPDEAGGFSSVNLALRRTETPVDELSERLRSLRERSAMAAALPTPEGEVIAGSGLTGGLPPAELEAKPGAPQVAHGLVISEDQQAQVKKLERILGLDAAPAPQVDADGKPVAVDPVKEAARIRKEALHARALSRRKPGRLVISLVLVAAVVLPFFLDVARLFNPPAAALNPDQQGTLDVSIEALRAGQRVLVGFEYGPTAAGEMDALAEPLLTHILLRGGRPVIVSSDSAGTLHARDVLDRLAHDEFLLAHLGRSPDDPLSMPRDYVILPYLSGGVVGLRALTAQNSRIFTVDLYGDPTQLRIDSLTRSFAFGLVLAERGEDIRLWAEQIGAATGLPLAAAVGVSAEPIARPYFDSGQLLGLLAGFRDAYIYDRVLLSSLPPVYPVNGAGEGDAQAAPPAEVTEEGGLAFLATPTPAGVAAQGLLTNTPAPTASPTPQVAATRTPRVTPTPEETTGAAAVDEDASPTPRPFITATPAPAEGETVAPAGGSAARAEALRPDRPYALERWYSLSLGALVATVVIGLGAVSNIVRGFRRRRDQ